ncbi:MAG: STAS domain-containing protein [bacterium]
MIHIEEKENVAVMRLGMEIAIREAMDLKEEVERAIERGFKYILLDFSNVEFMDSSGLGAVIGVKRRLKLKDGNFGIFGLNKRVEDLIKMVKLDRIIPIFESEEEGLKSLFKG